MRATLLALLALGLATAGSAAAGPLPPIDGAPTLPDVPLPDVPLPDLPGASAACLGLQVQLGTAGFVVTAPACRVNDVAAPQPEPVGAAFPPLPEVPLPPLPDLPAL